MRNFKNYEIWIDSIELSDVIYDICESFPKNELYQLGSQMERAVVSIPTNIAEGAGRNSNKDFANFLSIAMGSLFELHTQIVICEQIGYIDSETVKEIDQQIYTLQQQISTYKQRIEWNAMRQGDTSPTSGKN